MAIYRPIDEDDSEKAPKPTFQSKHEEDQYYFNMVDPKTGKKYDIPMLTPVDGDYYSRYISYMKMKEQSEETFNKILNWD